jgi:hypothetical protein
MACLSQSPDDRPSFAQIITLLDDMIAEVQRGKYIDSEGLIQVGISSNESILKTLRSEIIGSINLYYYTRQTVSVI